MSVVRRQWRTYWDLQGCASFASGAFLNLASGHTGSVWALDVNWDTTRMVTGSGDNTAKLWDVETGVDLMTFPHKSPVRSVAFAEGDALFLTVTVQVRF